MERSLLYVHLNGYGKSAVCQGLLDSVSCRAFLLESEFLFIFFPLNKQDQSMGINTIEPLYKSPSCQIRVGHFQMTGIGPGKGWGPGEGSSKAEIPVNGATCTPQMSLRRRKERESGKGKGNHRVWKLINSIHRI